MTTPLQPEEYKSQPDIKLSKKLSWLLRHGAIKEGLKISCEGYLLISDIMKHPHFEHQCSLDALERIVKNDPKQRYHIRRNFETGELEIRANQGHSIRDVMSAVEKERIIKAEDVPLAVHGTYYRHWSKIKHEGLKRLSRNHVHFSVSDSVNLLDNNGYKNVGTISGFRPDCQLLIYLNVPKALNDGLKLYRSTNNVILCPGLGHNGCIDTRYFERVIDRRTGQALNKNMEKVAKATKLTIEQKNVILRTSQLKETNKSANGIILETNNVCKICAEYFKSPQECLRHELLQHTFDRVRPKKAYRNKINAMLQIVMDNKRKELHDKIVATTRIDKLDVICEFYSMNKENFDIVYERIFNCLCKELHDQFVVYPFGSVLSELALRDSDIDFYLKPTNNKLWKNSMYPFNRVYNILQRSTSFQDIISIRHARVPIIKCKHSESGFSLDINVSSSDSVMNSMFLRDLVHWDNRLHQVLFFMKIWAKQLQVIGRGNMSSYCLITLVLFFLQQCNLLPSIKEMQANQKPNFINGINYAYNMNVLKPWPKDVTVFYLIREFFCFYQKFEFHNLLISPYLGNAILLKDLKDNFTEYKAQLESIQQATGEVPEHFQVNRIVRVQDPFSLAHNIAKSISYFNLAHFRACVSNAVYICKTGNVPKGGDIYERLLFDKLEELVMTQSPEAKLSKKANCNEDQHNKMATSQPEQDKSKDLEPFLHKSPFAQTYRIIPSRAEIRALQNNALMKQTIMKNTINYYWSFQYVQVIKEFITEIFCIDLRSVLPKQLLSLDPNNDQLQHSYIWDITAGIDMWTGRNHQRSEGKHYLECQQAQTSIFKKERYQKQDFIINLHGVLELHIDDQFKQIDITLRGYDSNGLDFQRNSPLTKFFAALKCGLQNFKLKERLESRKHKTL